MSYLLEIKGVKKAFTKVNDRHNYLHVLTGLDLTINCGEILCVLGNTGSGKTSLLNIISGIEQPDEGEIIIADGVKIGYVFQSNAVFPWRTVERNLTYALELKGVPKKKLKIKANELCGLIGLEPVVFLNKYPKELSGGENRRLALGMMLAYEANLLLLDEPTSQLDYFTACSIQDTIMNLQQIRKSTIIVVTHDIEEALYLANRIVIIKNGKTHSNIKLDFPLPRASNFRESIELVEKKRVIINIIRENGTK